MPFDVNPRYRQMFADFCARHDVDPESEGFMIPPGLAEEWDGCVRSLLLRMEDEHGAAPNCPQCLTSLEATGQGPTVRWECTTCGLVRIN